MSCDLHSTVPVTCAYVLSNCSNVLDGNINYLSFIYCSGQREASIFAVFLFLLFLFTCIGYAASDYFSPNVASVAEFLHLPPDIAGVTLLAFGNTAVDLVSNLVSIQALGSATLAVSEFIGASMVITLFVFGSICIIAGLRSKREFSENISLNPGSVIRDNVFYLFTLSFLLYVLSVRKLLWWHGLVMIITYVSYALTIVVTRNPSVKKAIKKLFRLKSPFSNNSDLSQSQEHLSMVDIPQPNPLITVENPLGQIQVEYFPEEYRVTEGTRDSSNQSALKIDTLAVPERFGRFLGPNSAQLTDRRSKSAESIRADMFRPVRHSNSVTSYASAVSNIRKKSALRDDISENVVNYVQDSIDRSIVVKSLQSAMEFWDAVEFSKKGSPNDTNIQDDHHAVELHGLEPEFHNSPEAESCTRAVELSEEEKLLSQLERSDHCPTCYKSSHRSFKMNGVLDSIVDHCFSIVRIWPIQSWTGKILAIVTIPASFLFSISIPVYAALDENEENSSKVRHDIFKEGECQYGKCIKIPWRHRWITYVQLFVFPIFICFCIWGLTGVIELPNGNIQIPYWAICVLVGFCFSFLCFLMSFDGKRSVRVASTNDSNISISSRNANTCSNVDCDYCLIKRKFAFKNLGKILLKGINYYPYICILGFISGVLWIYLISNEIVSILKTIGKVLNISETFLGVTLFAFGNSIGDLVTNLTIARLGYYSMGAGACFGAPLQNALLTLGLSGLIFKGAYPSGIELEPTSILMMSVISLIIVTSLNFLILGLKLKFKLNLLYGVFLIVTVFVLMAIIVTIEATRSGAR